MAGARLDRVCSTRAYPPLFRERHLKDYNRKNTLLLADTSKVPLTTSQVRTCKTVAERLRPNSLRAAQLTRSAMSRIPRDQYSWREASRAAAT